MKNWILFVLLTAGLCAQGSGNQSTGRLTYYVDHASFKMLSQKNSGYLQMYFYMSRAQFRFVKKDTLFSAGYTAEVTFTDVNNDKNVVSQKWNGIAEAAMADTANDIPVLFENGFLLKPGKYVAKIKIFDQNDPTRFGNYTEDITIADLDNNDLSVSDIELATQLQKGGAAEDMFSKNGFYVYPNPTRYYGSNLPRLTFYMEVYNLDYDPKGASNNYTAEFIVTNDKGTVVKEFPSKTFNKAGTSAVVMHSVNVISLTSGRYLFTVRITDNATKKVALTRKTFLVFREGESIYETQDGDSFFKGLDEKGAERAGNVIKLIGREDDYKVYEQLDIEGKKKFLDRFWKERDPSPNTTTNEALMDYYKRYEDANLKFSTFNLAGWKTEMGRVYVVYGAPAQIEKHEFESDKKPYQIWYYLQLKNQKTQVVFIFAEINENGGMRLIHSDARGEYTNSRWEEEVRRN